MPCMMAAHFVANQTEVKLIDFRRNIVSKRQWKRINHKQSVRWQNLSKLKASTFSL